MKKLLMSVDSSPETQAVGGGLAKRTFGEAPVMKRKLASEADGFDMFVRGVPTCCNRSLYLLLFAVGVVPRPSCWPRNSLQTRLGGRHSLQQRKPLERNTSDCRDTRNMSPVAGRCS